MEVEIVSRETIKPSCPTPHHLTSYKFSFLDQIASPLHFPFILYYTTDGSVDNSTIEGRRYDLKKSLSDTLTRYYPLAGRIIDNSLVDCRVNDDDYGVKYFEARVHNNGCPLSEFIQRPDINMLNQFLPCGFSSEVILAVQLNVFDCGGMAIGVRISHKIADASSFITFINDWAATARGDGAVSTGEQIKDTPRFDILPSLYPQQTADSVGFLLEQRANHRSTGEEIVSKRFVFCASKIAELKKRSKITFSSNNKIKDMSDVIPDEYPSRVEAVSALIWKCFMDIDQAKEVVAASAAGGDVSRVYVLRHSVNMRKRIVPPLPTNIFGNMLGAAFAQSINHNTDESEKDRYSSLARKIREGIRKVDNNYVRKLQSMDALLTKQMVVGISGNQSTDLPLNFSSWCGFPIYNADFGWGKPTWVSIRPVPAKNFVLFMDTSTGDGVEAWVSLNKEDMAKFERNEELLAYLSFDLV